MALLGLLTSMHSVTFSVNFPSLGKGLEQSLGDMGSPGVFPAVNRLVLCFARSQKGNRRQVGRGLMLLLTPLH